MPQICAGEDRKADFNLNAGLSCREKLGHFLGGALSRKHCLQRIILRKQKSFFKN